MATFLAWPGDQNRNNDFYRRGFDEVFAFERNLLDLDWLTTEELQLFRTEMSKVYQLYIEYVEVQNIPYKMSTLHQLLRAMDKHRWAGCLRPQTLNFRLLVNPTEGDKVCDIRNNLFNFVEAVKDLFLPESSYFSVPLVLQPRKDLPAMVERASERLFKQRTEDMCEEWVALKHVQDPSHMPAFVSRSS